MTNEEFSVFVAKYRMQFLAATAESGFVLGWQSKLMRFEPDELQYAIEELAADPREEARFARHHLPLIIEFASDRKARKQEDAQLAEYRRLQVLHGQRPATKKRGSP